VKYYYCSICKEEHGIPEDSDMAKRAVECSIHGHPRNAVLPPEFCKEGYWCSYCAKVITKEEYERARNEPR